MTSPRTRRSALRTLGVAIMTAGAGCVGGNRDSGETSFPSGEIRLIVPFSPGGGYDAYARLIAEHADLPLRVENVTGAAGDIAMEQLYTAEPDGYTVGISSLSIFPPRQLTGEVPYDMGELTYLPQIVDEGAALSCAPGVARDWEEFVERVNRDEIRFAGPPGGQTAFFAAVIGYFSERWAPERVFDNLVSFGGTAENMAGIQRGDAEAVVQTLSTAKTYVESGDLEFLLVVNEPTGGTMENVPEDVPWLREADIRNAAAIEDVTTLARVLVAPPGVPDERRTVLEQAFMRTLESEAFADAIAGAERPVNVLPGPQTAEKARGTLASLAEVPFLDEMP